MGPQADGDPGLLSFLMREVNTKRAFFNKFPPIIYHQTSTTFFAAHTALACHPPLEDPKNVF